MKTRVELKQPVIPPDEPGGPVHSKAVMRQLVSQTVRIGPEKIDGLSIGATDHDLNLGDKDDVIYWVRDTDANGNVRNGPRTVRVVQRIPPAPIFYADALKMAVAEDEVAHKTTRPVEHAERTAERAERERAERAETLHPSHSHASRVNK